MAPRPEFESESRARQARMIGRYTTGATGGAAGESPPREVGNASGYFNVSIQFRPIFRDYYLTPFYLGPLGFSTEEP